MLISAKKKWKTKPMRKRWIGERLLERRDAVGGLVVVRIGSPEWPPGAEQWRCPFIILGLGDDSIQYGYSIDSMGALQNAVNGIYYKLEQTGIPLRWEGFDEDITGFTRHVTWTFGLEFQQRLEKMIMAEEEELVRPIRERQEREEEARRKAGPEPQTG